MTTNYEGTSVSNPLEKAVEELSGSTAELPNALRRLMVVAARIRAKDLSQWLESELDGYGTDSPVPEYRRGTPALRLTYRGPMQSQRTIIVGPWDLPESLRLDEGWGDLRQSVAELSALQGAESDPQAQLPVTWLHAARTEIEAGTMATVGMMVLDGAAVVFHRTRLATVLDQVQTMALRFVLALEEASAEAGKVGGPTVSTDPEVAAVVEGMTIHLHGDHASVVIGKGNAMAAGSGAQAIVAAGDVTALLREVREVVGSDGVAALQSALTADGGVGGSEVRSWLDRVKNGSFVLASGMTTNGAYDTLRALLEKAFPGLLGG